MNFRTTVQNGLIVINTHGEIPDGTEVEVLPLLRKATSTRRPTKRASGTSTTKKTKKSSRRKGATKSGEQPLPGFGTWKHRKDIVDTAEFARELRRRVGTRKSGR